jgi:TIR domain
MVSSSSSRSKVFISYSHKDARYLKQLQTHLAYYERMGLVDVWDDTKLHPGTQWQEEIKNVIALTRVAILLVSADFLASQFIAENELPPLLTAAQSEGAVILSVILSACAFEETLLAQFQAVNSPSKPLLSMSKSDKEKTWHLVAKTVKEAINSQPAIEEMSKQSAEKKATQVEGSNSQDYDEKYLTLADELAEFKHKFRSSDLDNYFDVLVSGEDLLLEVIGKDRYNDLHANVALIMLHIAQAGLAKNNGDLTAETSNRDIANAVLMTLKKRVDGIRLRQSRRK